MGITGIFDADFGRFFTACQQAEAKLTTVEVAGAKVETQVKKIGEPGTTSGLGAFGSALGQVDKTLGALGVHIAPEIHALQELGDTAGKTATQIGLIGTAGLAAAAGIGGWKIGRLVADFFDLDQKIGSATARLLGWGDVAAQSAGAKADILARASAEAKRQITDLGEAVRFLDEAQKKRLDTAKLDAAALEAWTKAMVEINSVGGEWQQTLNAMDGETVAAVKFYLDAGVAQNVLATAYALTDVQIKAVVASLKEESEWRQLVADIGKTTHGLALDHEKEWRADIEQTKTARNQAVIEGDAQIRTTEADLADFLAKQYLTTAEYEIRMIWAVAEAEIKAFKGTEEQAARYKDARIALAQEQENAILASITTVMTAEEALLKKLQEDAVTTFAVIGGATAPVSGSSSSLARPQSLLRGAPLPAPAVSGFDWLSRPGVTTPTTINLNVSGVWDPATVQQMTDALSKELYQRASNGRKF